MSKYVLVFFDDNYADEFDISGHKVWEKDEWYKHLSDVREFLDAKVAAYKPGGMYDVYEHEVCFGTNESVFYSSYDSYVGAFRTKDISEEDYSRLELLELLEGGTFLTIDPEDYVYE